MTEAATLNRCGARWLAGCVAASFAAWTATPAAAQGNTPGAPLDPYGPAPAVAPMDPYPPGPPPVLPAPMLPPLPAPPPAYAAPIDPYGSYPGGYPAAPPAPVPDGCPTGCASPLAYRPVSPLVTELRPRYGVMAAGISILGGLWIMSTAGAVLSEHSELAVPLAGPILTAMDLNQSYGRSAGLSTLTGLLVMDALLQTTGLIMAIAGGASRVAVSRRAPQRPPSYPSVSPYGAGIGGRF